MEITDAITINRIRSEVFEYLSDITKRPDYIPQLEKIELLDAGALGQGSRYIEYASIAGRTFETTYQVIAFEAPQRIAVATLKSVFPIRVDLNLEERSGVTTVSITLKAVLKGIYALAAPVIEIIIRKQTTLILGNLKANLDVVPS